MTHAQRIIACMNGVRRIYGFVPVNNDIMAVHPAYYAMFEAAWEKMPRSMRIQWDDLA